MFPVFPTTEVQEVISTKVEQKVAHDKKSKFLTFHTKIAFHTVGNVVGFFFLKRFTSNPENDEIPRGPRDQNAIKTLPF